MIYYKKLKPIKAITFDLDDTLYENTSVIVNAEHSLIKFMHNQYPTTKDLNKHFWRAQQKKHLLTHPSLRNDLGELRKRALSSGFKVLGLSENEQEKAVARCFEHFYFQRSDFCIDKNVHFLLKELASRVPLVAITNGNVNLHQVGLDEYFCACFKASIALPMKPDRAMFDAAQKHLNVPHENILHVGDNLPKDVYGALKAGYQTAWYAEDRAMNMCNEKAQILPHVQLSELSQLLDLVERH